jgi:hypothetical protein
VKRKLTPTTAKQKNPTGKVSDGVLVVKEKHAGGRPPKFSTPKLLQTAIDEYFESCWFEKITETTDEAGNTEMSTVRYQQRPYTIAGLAYALDMTTQALRDYQAKPQFLCIIKKAKQKIEMNVEESLVEGKNAAGPIFWLKNHAGYRDKQEIELSGTLDLADRMKAARERSNGR